MNQPLWQVARITFTGTPSDDEIKQNAWLLWRSVAGDAERKGAQPVDDEWLHYEGSFRAHVHRLWPELFSPAVSDEEAEAFERMLYRFLRDTENARCIRSHDPTIWYVRKSWSGKDAPVKRRFRSPRKNEQTVSANEAGEDREAEPVTTTTKREASLQAHREKLREERERRIQDIEETLKLFSNEPITVDEIAFYLGAEISGVRKGLAELAEQNKAFSRTETAEERELRYGGVARSVKAALWHQGRPVPPRTKREVVPGFVRAPAPTTHMGRVEVRTRLFKWVKANVEHRGVYTAAEVAESTGLNSQTVRQTIDRWVAEGLVQDAGTDRRKRFKVTNKTQLLQAIRASGEMNDVNGNGQQTLPAPTPPAPRAPHPRPTPSKPAASLTEVEQMVHDVVEKNEQLTVTVRELRAENAELKKEIGRLKNPPLSDELTQRLRRASGR